MKPPGSVWSFLYMNVLKYRLIFFIGVRLGIVYFFLSLLLECYFLRWNSLRELGVKEIGIRKKQVVVTSKEKIQEWVASRKAVILVVGAGVYRVGQGLFLENFLHKIVRQSHWVNNHKAWHIFCSFSLNCTGAIRRMWCERTHCNHRRAQRQQETANNY